jgi:hypothetical protein
MREISITFSRILTLVSILSFCLCWSGTVSVYASNYGEGNYGADLYGKETPAPAGATICSEQEPRSAPILTTAQAKSGTQVELTFTKAQDPFTYYAVQYGTQSGTYPFASDNIGNKDTTSYTVNSLSPYTTYYFQVRAGNGCAPGTWSNEISVKTASLVTRNRLDLIQTTFEEKKNEENDSTSTESREQKDQFYTVSIKILNKRNETVENANVTVDSKSSQLTDITGVATFTSITPGEHTIEISNKKYIGMETVFLSGDTKDVIVSVVVDERDITVSSVPIVPLAIVVLCIVIFFVVIKRRRTHIQNF